MKIILHLLVLTQHDVSFVELRNGMIHTYYDEVNVDIDLDMEFNSESPSQFKCIRAIHRFGSRTCSAYMSTLKLVMAKVNLMAWVVL